MADLLIDDDGAVRYLTLNRPEKRNALNDALIASLKDALREAGEAGHLRAIVIRGAGKDFCSGADLASLERIAAASFEENLEDARSLAELFSLIRFTPMPVIAAVTGRALAGGCGLATACDLVAATRTARFGYPEVKIGFVPAIVMAFLRRNVSEKAAFEMATQGFEFSAEDALQLQLVNRLFDEGTFEADVRDYVSIYENVSPSAVALSKELLYRMDGLDFAASLEAGSQINAKARSTDDCRAGIRKFLQR